MATKIDKYLPAMITEFNKQWVPFTSMYICLHA